MKKRIFRLVSALVVACASALLVAAFHSAGSESAESHGSGERKLPPIELTNPMCMRPTLELASLTGARTSSPWESPVGPAIDAVPQRSKNLAPLRTIWEPGPNFSGVFVDAVNDEIVAIDNNHNQIVVYARLANGLTAPLRTIHGPTAQVDFPSAVFVDNRADEIYVVDNEISDRVTIHRRTARGEAAPLRSISVRLTTSDKRYSGGVMHPFGLWADPESNEFVVTTQIGNNISTFDARAASNGIPKRNIQGKKTGLANPRGVSIDKARGEIVVVTDGHLMGSVIPPSIRFFKRDADGDVAPLRTIEGPATMLNRAPKALYLDTVNDEIYIAVTDNAVLVFPRTATGNEAPVRVLQGASTGLDHPTGVFVDTVNNEMAVSNWENFSITIYPRTANGNVRPIRTIRASSERKAVGLLRGRGLNLDRVNDEIWHLN